jgi:hypothetical protein
VLFSSLLVTARAVKRSPEASLIRPSEYALNSTRALAIPLVPVARRAMSEKHLISSCCHPFSFATSPTCVCLHGLCLLLGSRFGLGSLLLVAANHYRTKECSHNSNAYEDEDDRNPDGPDARGKEALKGMVVVNEGLSNI